MTPPPAPVLLLGFNRPDLFSKLLDVVKQAGPRDLLIGLDGPREGNGRDAGDCAAVRRLAEGTHWAPNVHLNIREHNLGCGPAVASAIDWTFERVERAIVLEDDCLPDLSFFAFCDELLERYADDERVMQIAASNWGASEDRYRGWSYGFSTFGPVWGWATWRRAWKLYEYKLDSWPRFKRDGLLDGVAISKRFQSLMRYELDTVYAGGGTWDHQWQYAVMRHSGLSVSPSRNLCVNLGFRSDGTSVTEPDYVFSNMPLESLPGPLVHPPEVARNPAIDALFEKVYWHKLAPGIRLYRKLVRDERVRRQVRRVTQTARRRPR